MTVPVPPSGASDSDAREELELVVFASGTSSPGWYVVNDNVMGGRSDGDFGIEQGELHFSGRTNTDGGGFSSIRTEAVKLDLSTYDGIRLRVKGDGRRYTWRLTTDAQWRGREVAYWADFDTEDGAWSTVDIPFSRFVPRFRGTRLDGPALNTAEIAGMGLMIYDKLDGRFELHLAGVAAYAVQAPFTLERYRWKNRVLVLSARSRADKNLEKVQDDVDSKREAFADRDMVLVTLLDSGTSTAGDRALTAAEAEAARAALDIAAGSFALRLIGKDGSVKLSRESALPVREIFALIDTMPMRQRETFNR